MCECLSCYLSQNIRCIQQGIAPEVSVSKSLISCLLKQPLLLSNIWQSNRTFYGCYPFCYTIKWSSMAQSYHKQLHTCPVYHQCYCVTLWPLMTLRCIDSENKFTCSTLHNSMSGVHSYRSKQIYPLGSQPKYSHLYVTFT